MRQHDITPFFAPKSVAVFGSFKESFFGGYPAIKQLIRFGYQGNIYPINPHYDEAFGFKAYPSIKEVPETVDLAMIMTNASAAHQIIMECAGRIKAAIIVSDGFAERDKEGAALQRTIVDIAKRGGMRIIGPNTAGMMSAPDSLISCAFECTFEKANNKGVIALVGQTGLVAPQAIPWHESGYSINKLIDLGNKCDVDESDILEYLSDDPMVKVIAFHLEDIKDGQRFLKIVKETIKKKPILVLKAGRTKEGARALISHTGSLAGDDKIFDTVCKQAGIIRVDRWTELVDFARMLAHQPLPKGNRLGILSASGGLAAIVADAAIRYGLSIATLSSESSRRLKELYPPTWGSNPIDYGAPASYYGNWLPLYQEALNTLVSDDNVDCIATVTGTDPFGVILEDLTELTGKLSGRITKPIATWIYGPIPSHVADASHRLEGLGFPVYYDPETSVKALSIMYKYANLI